MGNSVQSHPGPLCAQALRGLLWHYEVKPSKRPSSVHFPSSFHRFSLNKNPLSQYHNNEESTQTTKFQFIRTIDSWSNSKKRLV